MTSTSITQLRVIVSRPLFKVQIKILLPVYPVSLKKYIMIQKLYTLEMLFNTPKIAVM